MNIDDVDPRARPIRYAGERGAVLMLHGLTGTPYTYGPLARLVADAGFAVYAPLLPGHGTSPERLQHTRWNDWLIAARRAFDELAQAHEAVFVIGFSMGGLLSIVVSQERGAQVSGLVVMGVPLVLDMKTQLLLEAGRYLPLAQFIPFAQKKDGPDVSDPAVAAAMPTYDSTPVAAAISLLDGQDMAKERASRLGIPVLVLHGRHDHVAPARNARLLMSLLNTPTKRMILYPHSWHIMTLDVDHEQLQDDVLAFLESPATLGRS